MNKEVLNWVTDLFTVLERTRLKIYDCDEITITTQFKNKDYLVKLTNDRFEIYKMCSCIVYRFYIGDTDNSINRGVLTKLTQEMSE